MRRPKVLVAATVLALLLVFPSLVAAQCAMCATAFDSPEGRRIAGRYRAGILFLLSVPFVTFGTVAVMAVRGQRRLDDD